MEPLKVALPKGKQLAPWPLTGAAVGKLQTPLTSEATIRDNRALRIVASFDEERVPLHSLTFTTSANIAILYYSTVASVNCCAALDVVYRIAWC